MTEHTQQQLEKAREYAWNYFALHSSQRIAVFNFFVVMSGALTAGIASILQGSPKLAFVGVLIGPLLSLLSFVFWKLDQRTSFLIKHSESTLANIEDKIAVAPGHIFLVEPQNTRVSIDTATVWSTQWTYGSSFRLIFLIMGVLGIVATLISILKYAGKIIF